MRLASSASHAAGDELAVDLADLARHDQPVAGGRRGCRAPTGAALRSCVHTSRRSGRGLGTGAASGRAARRSATRRPRPPPRTRRRTRSHGPAPSSALDDSTSIGGMSTARRTPNERIVRSCTSPSASTASPSLVTQPAPCGPRRCSSERSTTSSSGSPHAHPHRRPRSSPTVAVGDRAVGRSVTGAGVAARAPAPQHRGLGPARRPERRPTSAGPATSTSSTTRPGATAAMASAMPGVRTTRTTPVPSAPMPAASGGRLGPSRTASSRDSSDPHRPAVRVGQRRAAAAHRRGRLAAERAAVGERRRRLAAGHAPGRRRSRGRPARPTTSAASRPSRPSGTSSGGSSADGGAPALHLAGRGPRLGQRLADRPTRRRPSGTATSASAGAVSSANPPAPSATSGADPLGRPALERRPPGGGRPGHAAVGRSVAPSGGRGESPRRRRSSASRCTGTGGRASARSTAVAIGEPAAWRRRPSSRTMIPGVQKPHWLAAGGAERVGPGRQRASARPSRVVTDRPGDPPDRRHARDPRAAPSTSTVQQPHWPWGLHPSFAVRTPRSSRSTSSSEPAARAPPPSRRPPRGRRPDGSGFHGPRLGLPRCPLRRCALAAEPSHGAGRGSRSPRRRADRRLRGRLGGRRRQHHHGTECDRPVARGLLRRQRVHRGRLSATPTFGVGDANGPWSATPRRAPADRA